MGIETPEMLPKRPSFTPSKIIEKDRKRILGMQTHRACRHHDHIAPPSANGHPSFTPLCIHPSTHPSICPSDRCDTIARSPMACITSIIKHPQNTQLVPPFNPCSSPIWNSLGSQMSNFRPACRLAFVTVQSKKRPENLTEGTVQG